MKPDSASILVVDDIPDNIKIASIILRSVGYEVDSAGNAAEVLDKIENNKYDLILLDVVMPDRDGFSVCRELKENPATKDIPVIFLTAKTGFDDMLEGFKAGAVDYITKPFRSAEVKVRVNTHIELKRTKDTLQEKFDQEKKLSAELKDALSKVKFLSGLLPICSYCFKIRDNKGYWQRVDEYIRSHSEADFTHGI
ncbi:MAG: response regulator, partial [Elusimicrobiota bacterium]